MLFLLAAALTACQRQDDTAPALVTPTVSLARADAAVGSPIEMTYRFAVAPDARFDEDYWVFVHFVDADRELMWTDDHQPPVPTRQWQPGSTVEYSRTLFIPKFPYVGETRVEVGLFSRTTGERVPMAGTNEGQRSYQVATFNLRMQSDNMFVVFKEGWQNTEVSPEDVGLEWQWSKKEGILAFRNPMRDVMLYLQLDQPVAAIGPQHVDVRLGATVLDSFDLAPGENQLRKIRINKDVLGDTESIDVAVVPGKTFIPASIPELKNPDSRELGVRVFRAALQPL
jgi:hypothetical protein